MRLRNLLLGLLLVTAACSGAERDSSGEIIEGGNLSAFDVEVGDCFNDPDAAEVVYSVEAVVCAEPHDNEVFALLEYPASDSAEYPGQVTVEEWTADSCIAEFTEYVGTDFWESSLDIIWLVPTEESWGQGDREVVCALKGMEEKPLTGTVAGSGL